METLAAGLPTLLIDEYNWWHPFQQYGVHVAEKSKAADKLIQLYLRTTQTPQADWCAIEASTQRVWSQLLD